MADETVIVDQNTTTVSTQVKDTKKTADKGDDIDPGQLANVAIGTVAYDTATLDAREPRRRRHRHLQVLRRGGRRRDHLRPLAAAIDGDGPEVVTGTNGSVPDSSDASPSTLRAPTSRVAVYSGDANNKDATSACGSETVIVDQNTTGITTQVKNNAGDGNIANGANVAIGTVAYDTADVTGETAGAGGTVQFYVEKGDATCSVDGATDLGSKALGVKSNTTTFAEAGTYYFWAVYSGDDNNQGATSDCSSETVVVDKNTTGITTQVKDNAGDGNIANGANVAIGTVAYDTARRRRA